MASSQQKKIHELSQQISKAKQTSSPTVEYDQDANPKVLRKNLMSSMPNSNPNKSHAIHAQQQQQQRVLPKRPASGSAITRNRRRPQSASGLLDIGGSPSMTVVAARRAATPLPITPHSNGAPQKNVENAVQTLLAFGNPAAAAYQQHQQQSNIISPAYKNFHNPVTAHINKQNKHNTGVKVAATTARAQLKERGGDDGGGSSFQYTIASAEPLSSNPNTMVRTQPRGVSNSRCPMGGSSSPVQEMPMFPLSRYEKCSSAAVGIYGRPKATSLSDPRPVVQSPTAHHRKRHPVSQPFSNKEGSIMPPSSTVSAGQPPVAWGRKGLLTTAQTPPKHTVLYDGASHRNMSEGGYHKNRREGTGGATTLQLCGMNIHRNGQATAQLKVIENFMSSLKCEIEAVHVSRKNSVDFVFVQFSSEGKARACVKRHAAFKNRKGGIFSHVNVISASGVGATTRQQQGQTFLGSGATYSNHFAMHEMHT